MRRLVVSKRIPLLAALLVACGDDTGDAADETTGEGGSESTGAPATDGPSTGTTEGADVTTDGASSSNGSSSSSDTTDGSSSSDDTDTTSGASTTSVDNDAPQGDDDVLYGVQGEDLVLDASAGVLANDVDPDGDALFVSAFDASSAHGAEVTIDADGALTYDAPSSFWGPDTFEYTISDGIAEGTAQVTVYVAPVHVQLERVADGIGGYVIESEQDGSFLGDSVSGLGDLDGDGLDDVIIGAYSADTPAPFLAPGRAYVVFGRASTDPVALVDIVGEAGGGFVVNGDDPGGQLGRSVGDAGDVNGDGQIDFVVGAPTYGPDPGYVHVVFGRGGSEPTEIADVVAGVGGFGMHGESDVDAAGYSVAGAGDVNDDGLDDVIIGAPFADPGGPASGRSYIVFGRNETTLVELADVAAGVGGFAIDGASGSDYTGVTVSGAGDVNGDGFADVLVAGGTPFYQGGGGGHAYVVFGKADTALVQLADVEDGVGGFELAIEPGGGQYSIAVSDAGDIDGDGLADVMVGDRTAQDDDGRVYLVYGKADTAPVELGDLGDGGFTFDGLQGLLGIGVGSSVDVAGDVDGDGIDDFLIGQEWADTPDGDFSGRVYVVYGTRAPSSIDLTDVAMGIGGFVLDGQQAEGAGGSVSRAGDVDGDGLADIVIGAESADPLGPYTGRGYVVFGVPTGPA